MRILLDAGGVAPLKGFWSQVEPDAFVLGLSVHGRDWKLIQLLVKTWTLTQIRTHAQKHLNRGYTRLTPGSAD
jgi:hypothetical protein